MRIQHRNIHNKQKLKYIELWNKTKILDDIETNLLMVFITMHHILNSDIQMYYLYEQAKLYIMHCCPLL